MGTPRESVRLVREGGDVRMVAPKSGNDWTEAMRAYSAQRVEKLATAELCGLRPQEGLAASCGMERVKVYGEGMPTKSGRGLFAEALLARFPNLPVEEEGRLCDPGLRDNFVERVFAYHRLRRFFSGRWTVGGLVAFHTAHKLQLMAHAPKSYGALGRLVARGQGASEGRAPRELRDRVHAGAQGDRDHPPQHQRAPPHPRLLQEAARRRGACRAARPDRGLPARPGAAHRPDHAHQALRAAALASPTSPGRSTWSHTPRS